MIEIRIHGRGGQGAVIASLVIAHAVHRHGFHVQVFPEFGVERRGVPVTAFARVDQRPIRLRTRITQPDHVLILDGALAHYLPVTAGLKKGGWIVVNAENPENIGIKQESWQMAWVDATAIAARHGIGTATAPIVNTTMIGAFAAVTGLFTVEDFLPAMSELVPDPARNAAAATEAFHSVAVLSLESENILERSFGRP